MLPVPRILVCLLAGLSHVMAQPASKQTAAGHPDVAAVPKYTGESPLPEGWPEPGPYGQVVRKDYPAYRGAFTPDASPNKGFRRLFKHISKNNIPMTAPVEMKMGGSDAMVMEEMAFLYRTPDVGQTGADGELVEIRDIPAVRTLSYTWQGGRDKESIARARKAIDDELANRKLKVSGYRLLGYNSPFMPLSKQTHELQALLK